MVRIAQTAACKQTHHHGTGQGSPPLPRRQDFLWGQRTPASTHRNSPDPIHSNSTATKIAPIHTLVGVSPACADPFLSCAVSHGFCWTNKWKSARQIKICWSFFFLISTHNPYSRHPSCADLSDQNTGMLTPRNDEQWRKSVNTAKNFNHQSMVGWIALFGSL